MTGTCNRCAHHRLRPRPLVFSPTELQTPGALKAHLEWEATRTERAQREQQMLNDGLRFLYEPHSLLWCSAFTELELVARAKAGDRAALEAALERGAAALNPVTGELSAVYALCDRHNHDQGCRRHEPI